ncbi:MAG: hypothetical protein A2Z99_10660 [Treponema sp. GWB1_62_6]|nr:MAG: hypothetical protein A2Z99_10660 [Treponema sp. GWB1_62_6]OHE63658.1 MAG: hypothetical protein A2001_14155 [Treponema sp. GWC1_61_84]OHE71812.1 MAG: hypothetical protein A2413_03995 [Treponema sp. RIFOXYC1_FULL_61_9]HCM25726.1 hydrogenase [Treponema sp.]
MEAYLPGMIVGFREGLEAFLVIAIALKVLDKSGRQVLKKAVWLGTVVALAASAAAGAALSALGEVLGGSEVPVKLWESAASLIALALVSTFIVWMIRHGSDLGISVKETFSGPRGFAGMALAAFALVAREGGEIALFAFAGTYPFTSIMFGVAAALILTLAVSLLFVKVNLSAIFNLTLAYLILQAGFLLGYSVHEGLSALKEAGFLAAGNPLLSRAFDLSKTVFEHKQGPVGLPLFVLVGWYSRPEWIQFILQISYSAGMFLLWFATRRGKAAMHADRTRQV